MILILRWLRKRREWTAELFRLTAILKTSSDALAISVAKGGGPKPKSEVFTMAGAPAASVDAGLAAMSAQIQATVGTEASAKALIDGFQARVDAAVAAALAKGATAAQLQEFTDLSAQLKTSSDALAADVAANPAP